MIDQDTQSRSFSSKTIRLKSSLISKNSLRTSLVAQWLRIRLSMQGTQVRSLIPEKIPHAAEQLSPRATTTEARSPRAPVLHNKRSHRNQKPPHCNEEQPSLAAARKSLRAAMKTQCTKKKKKNSLRDIWEIKS